MINWYIRSQRCITLSCVAIDGHVVIESRAGGDLDGMGTKHHICNALLCCRLSLSDTTYSSSSFQPKGCALRNNPIPTSLRYLGWAQGRSERFMKSLFGTHVLRGILLLARSRVVLGVGNLSFGLLQPHLQIVSIWRRGAYRREDRYLSGPPPADSIKSTLVSSR